jgi:uncharacterized membrane protein YjjB (DUF3815 family)
MTDATFQKSDGFWRQQFQPQTTTDQNSFDWTFGVIVPVICIFIDPIVFRSSLGEAILGEYKPLIFIQSFVNILGLMGWLLRILPFKGTSVILAGLFFISAISSGITGIVVGLAFLDHPIIFLLAALGYLPLFTAGFVYFRNAVRAFHRAKLFIPGPVALSAFVLSSSISIAVPIVANISIDVAIDKMVRGTPEQIISTADRIKYIAPVVNFDKVAKRYCDRSYNRDRRKALADVYYRFTGLSTRHVRFRFCGESMVGDEKF